MLNDCSNALQHTYWRSGPINTIHILHGWHSPIVVKQRTDMLKSSICSKYSASNITKHLSNYLAVDLQNVKRESSADSIPGMKRFLEHISCPCVSA